MKVLMLTSIELPRRSASPQIPPMGCMVLSSQLRKHGHETGQFDLDIEHLADPGLAKKLQERESTDPESLESYIRGEGPDEELDKLLDKVLAPVDFAGYDLVGISAKRPLGARLLAKRIKDRTPVLVVAGGDFASDAEEFIRSTPHIDYIITGRGEWPLLSLIDALEGRAAFEAVEKMHYRRDGDILTGAPDLSKHSINDQPPPDFSGLRHELYRHQRPYIQQLPNPGCRIVMPYYFIEGCPFNCSYCRTRKFSGIKDTALIADELEFLRDSTGCRDFIFLNDSLNAGRKSAVSICREIEKKGLDIRWTDSLRPDVWSKGLFEHMAAAGCVSVVFGIESASDLILEKMNRRYKVEDAAAALKESHETGFINRINMIVGFPGETDEEFGHSLDFVTRNSEYIDNISISQFYLVRSELTAHPEKYGILLHDGADAPQCGDSMPFDERGGMKWEDRPGITTARAETLKETYLEARNRQRPIGNIYEIFELTRQHRTKAAIYESLRERRGSRFMLFVGTECNNRCGHCPYASYRDSLRHRPFEDIAAEIEIAARNGYEGAVLVGGEPAVRKDFFDILGLLEKSRFKTCVETNGRVFSSADFTKKVSGYRSVEIAIHGLENEEEEHDGIAGVKGAFRQSVRGLKNCMESQLPYRLCQRHIICDGIPAHF